MAGTSEQTNQNSGEGAGTIGQGVGRDVNATLGSLSVEPSLDLGSALSNLGAATSSATSGAVTIGDRILGGNKSSRQFGIVKILVLFAGTAILLKLYQKYKKG